MSNGQQVTFTLDGESVVLDDVGRATLLEVLRDRCGVTSVKDGCSPQGQCGCCTVLVDGQPRVACVTPARRVEGRAVQTVDGLDGDACDVWGEALCATGGSQCGFCTPGIVVRLEGLRSKLDAPGNTDRGAVDQALLAHLCRCTGWQTIREAWDLVVGGATGLDQDRDLAPAAERASIEGRADQIVGADVALGRAPFAADTAPDDALIAVWATGTSGDVPDGEWVAGKTLTDARAAAGKVQGRRTTADHAWPLEVPAGDWDLTLRTTWVEPAALETDASWCEPGGDPASPLANGGAFGAKATSPVPAAARRLADEHGRPVLALASREDTVRWGPKRPPLANSASLDGDTLRGAVHVAATPGIAEAIGAVAPGVDVIEHDVPGPPTTVDARGAGWVEVAVVDAALRARRDDADTVDVASPEGSHASASFVDGRIAVTVRCGRPLDDVVLRSYAIGAAHMAWSWVTAEALTVDADGEIHDLTVRSFGVLRAVDTPEVDVTIEADDGPAVNGSDAVFAAVAALAWQQRGWAPQWPAG